MVVSSSKMIPSDPSSPVFMASSLWSRVPVAAARVVNPRSMMAVPVSSDIRATDLSSARASAKWNARHRKMESVSAIRFYVKEYASYAGRNPKSGEKVTVKAKKLPVFKAGTELKRRVDQ
jgi:hypothetical protein